MVKYMYLYSDNNSISDITDLKKGHWPNIETFKLGSNRLTKIKIRYKKEFLFLIPFPLNEFLFSMMNQKVSNVGMLVSLPKCH